MKYFSSIPKWYILIVMSHCGFFISYALRVNFSVAIVAMVNSTKTGKNVSLNKIEAGKGSFNWDGKKTRLGSWFVFLRLSGDTNTWWLVVCKIWW